VPRIVVLPADETACGQYRMRWPALAVTAVRPDWTIEVYKPQDVKISTDPRTGIPVALRGVPNPASVDLYVTQRVGTVGALSFYDWCRRRGAAVVLDADDAMWSIDRGNAAWRHWNSDGLHWRNLDAAAAQADVVTVTTEVLAQRYGAHGRVAVIPNRVPYAALAVPGERGLWGPEPAIGWAGFVATHPTDLYVVGDAVAKVVAETGARVRVIGDAAGAGRAWGIEPESLDTIHPRPLLGGYYSALTALDIALVPLAHSTFNRGKSALKALEFSAAGVPVIASPTPANRALAKQVPILLAESPMEWGLHIRELLSDPEGARQRGAVARDLVRVGWMIEDHGEVWAQAWERAMVRRAAMV
jgi:glycosyltransferase involved in cell wall biosynthesis